MSEPIRFVAEVAKVQTLSDGGIRVTFDLPETATMQMAQLAECKRFGAVLTVMAVADVAAAEPVNWMDLYNGAEKTIHK